MKSSFNTQKIFALVSLSISAFALLPEVSSSNASLPDNGLSPAQEDPVDAPARVHDEAPWSDSSRISRKPAVEPRVYIESASSRTGFVFFDYADQKPTTDPARAQRPPSQ
jgi:hypothetical protein